MTGLRLKSVTNRYGILVNGSDWLNDMLVWNAANQLAESTAGHDIN